MANILPTLKAAYPGPPDFTVTVLVNKYRATSTDYRKVRTLLRSGVGYNNETGIIETLDEKWEVFTKRFPYLKSIRNKGFPYMDEMAVVWPSEIPTGAYIVEANEANNPTEISDGDEEEELVGSRQQQKKRKRPTDFDPDTNPFASDPSTEVPSEVATPKKRLSRPAVEQLEAFNLLGGSIERGLSSLGGLAASPAITATAPRVAGSDDIVSALRDFQLLFGEKLGGRAVAKIGRLFASAPLDAVAWLGIKSTSGKEEFLREVGIIEI